MQARIAVNVKQIHAQRDLHERTLQEGSYDAYIEL